jgi:DNA primase
LARIKDTSVEAVRGAVDMVDLVGGRTQLRKAGARWTARCPFHEERTPSFSVNAVDKLYYCFGCGAKGDAITFVRETENLDFAGAIEWLAERFRVELEYEDESPRQDAERKRRERLLALLEQATGFYERYLWDTAAGEPVRAYLAGRGLEEAVCREFRLGLAPRGSMLVPKARAQGFSAEELQAAGLAGRRGGDYFSGRLLFPLANARGRVVGFQARRLSDDDPLKAKYVNSPEGELFRKGALLYGLHAARNAIAKHGRALVVEGNTDVLALRQAGVEPVVASMGTALTEQQLKELGRLAHVLFLCFDADAAGEAATLRGMDLAHGQGLDVRVVALPPGSDPADEAAGFEDRLRHAEPYLLYRVRLIIKRADDRQAGFDQVEAFLAPFKDSPHRQDAQRLAADMLDLPRELQAGLAPHRQRSNAPTVSRKMLQAGDRLERMFLAAAVHDPAAAAPWAQELGDEHFDTDEHRRLRAFLAGDANAEEKDTAALHAELWATAETEGISSDQASGLALELKERWVDREIAALEQGTMSRDDERRHAELVRFRGELREAVAGLA